MTTIRRSELGPRPESDLRLIDQLEALRLTYGTGPWPILEGGAIFGLLATAIEHQDRSGPHSDGVLATVLDGLCPLAHALLLVPPSEDATIRAMARDLSDLVVTRVEYAAILTVTAQIVGRGAVMSARRVIVEALDHHGLSVEERTIGAHRRGEHRASTRGGDDEPRGGFGPLILE